MHLDEDTKKGRDRSSIIYIVTGTPLGHWQRPGVKENAGHSASASYEREGSERLAHSVYAWEALLWIYPLLFDRLGNDFLVDLALLSQGVKSADDD